MAETARWLGTTLGSWRIRALLGEGAFGAVFEADHLTQPGLKGALKVLHPRFASDDTIKQRFLNEATAASRAQHQNIVQILDGGIAPDGVCFEVMELLRGLTLTAALAASGRFDIERTVHIGLQVASALGSAHSVQVIHRDLKPDNIFLVARPDNPDFVKVLDFGVAKLRGDGGSSNNLTNVGSIIGTNAYMSPEQWMARPDIDGRADIYALGIILFQCLTSEMPFKASNAVEWVRMHIEDIPADLSSLTGVLPETNQVIQRMMAKKPEDRPPTMYAVMRELNQVLARERLRPGAPPRRPSVQRAAVTVEASAPALEWMNTYRSLPSMDEVAAAPPPPPDFEGSTTVDGALPMHLALLLAKASVANAATPAVDAVKAADNKAAPVAAVPSPGMAGRPAPTVRKPAGAGYADRAEHAKSAREWANTPQSATVVRPHSPSASARKKAPRQTAAMVIATSSLLIAIGYALVHWSRTVGVIQSLFR